jgi:hypothetical protein
MLRGSYGQDSGVEAVAECHCFDHGKQSWDRYHPVASAEGQCGFYVVHDRSYVPTTIDESDVLYTIHVAVEVEGWGRVSEYTDGWRVERLRVLRIVYPPPGWPKCSLPGPAGSPYACGLPARYVRTYDLRIRECGEHVVSGRNHVQEIETPVWSQERLDEWRRDLPTDWEEADG